MATGIDWVGHKVKSGGVFYIAAEGGIGVSRRIRAWEIAYYSGNTIQNIARIDTPIYPAGQQNCEHLYKAILQFEETTQTKVRLIVLDTLARCFGNADENTAKDMGAFIQGCDWIKAKTGACILVVHHLGKDQDKGARGSSAFKAALDAEFHIQRDKDAEQSLIIHCTKMKDAEEPKDSSYHLNPITLFYDEDEEAIGSLVLDNQSENLPMTHLVIHKEICQKRDASCS